jgi:hypothetical protein
MSAGRLNAETPESLLSAKIHDLKEAFLSPLGNVIKEGRSCLSRYSA